MSNHPDHNRQNPAEMGQNSSHNRQNPVETGQNPSHTGRHPDHTRQIKHGEDLYTAGQPNAALAVFEAVLREDPNNVAALNDAGTAADEIGDSLRAVEYYEKALDLDDANHCAFFNLIDLLAREDAADLAVEVFQKYQATIPDSVEFRKYADAFRGANTEVHSATDIEDLTVQVRRADSPRKHVIIVAQPRSGGSVFSHILHQDRRFLCFDEPFRPQLRSFVEADGGKPHQTVAEYVGRTGLMKSHWSTIQPYEEYYPDFVGHQENYVRALLGEGDHVCIDVLRCCGKVDALRQIAPDALIIHLVRDPRAWVTSNLRPYGDWLPGLPDQFFSYDQPFDLFGRQAAAHAVNAQGHAHEQLLQVWNHFVGRAEAAQPDLTIRFEHFALDPDSVLRTVYEQLDLAYPELDLGGIAEPNPPYAAYDGTWGAALDRYTSPANRQFLFDYNSIPVAA